jgi:hypothetical protein
VPGAYVLTLVAAGSGITDAAGNALAVNASDAWTVPPPPAARVVGRHVFYNGSAYDGHDALAGASDDAAIASDKVALLPAGGRAGFAHYTSYSRGLNGVMIDVAGPSAGAAGGGATWSIADFAFRFGNTLNPADWAVAPAPTAVIVRAAAGVGGSDRVTLVWADGRMVGGWLQVTVLATASTRLGAPDVFYFGNLPGETGDVPDAAIVNGSDVARTRGALGTSDVEIDNAYDHNRDGRVDVRDLYIVRSAIGSDPLPLIGLTWPSASTASGPAARGAYRPGPATSLLGDDAAVIEA